MKKLTKMTTKKWTRSAKSVHFNLGINGQGDDAQVFDFISKACCPLIRNLGVNREGTLPGKA